MRVNARNALAVGIALAATLAPSSAAAAPPARHGVRIRWAAHHIPRIRAPTFAGAGYGMGFAQATDNVCVLADRFATEDAQRSRLFGPDATYRDTAIGSDYRNLDSDFFYQRIKDEHTVERLLAQPPPIGPSARARALVRGYAAGFNGYLRRRGVERLPDRTCRGAAWVHPIRALDVWRHVYATELLSSSRALLEQIVRAQPPLPALPLPGPLARRRIQLPAGLRPRLGSNAIAVGSAGTRNHRGLLLANPHFPWRGSERFYQSHLTIPGKLDVAGVSLLGTPNVEIGHTRGMAWTHTVNFSFRFALYELSLVPGQPRSYVYDGALDAMRPETVSVMARTATGTLEPRSHTFWLSRYGPMVDVQPPAIGWNPLKAYAIEDMNAGDLRLVDQFIAIDRAQTVPGLHRALVRWQGIPWVNTIAADSKGRTLFADISVTPHITDEQIQSCVTPGVGTAALQVARLPVLDGSKPSCALGSDADAVQPGIFGPSHLPALERRDYVRNSNDPPWLANPHHPLGGYPFVTNDTEHDIGLRPRLSIKMVEARLLGRDGYGAPGFNVPLTQRLALNDRNYSAELAHDAVVSMCERNPTLVASDGTEVDVRAGCAALRGWDLHARLRSRGEGLWKEFWLRVLALSSPVWTRPFDAADPVDTPAGFNTASPDVQRALADAVEYLRAHAIAPDAPVSALQSARGIPLHGCDAVEGCFDDVGLSNSPTAPMAYHLADYARPDFGSSSIQVTGWRRRHGRVVPVARTVLIYGQSADRASRYSRDQTRLFSRGRWVAPR